MLMESARSAQLLATAQRRRYASRPATVLAHVDSLNGSRVKVAVQVANAFSAKLIGVSTIPNTTTDAEESAARLIAEASAARFEDLSAGVRAGASWTVAEGPPEAALQRLAWAADLILTDDHMTRHGDASALRALVLGSGRPILICPDHAEARWSNVVAVWDGSPACTRALRAAIPIFAQAESITVVLDQLAGHESMRELNDLRRGLYFRGISLEISPDRDIERSTANRRVLATCDADLVVMAAWPKGLNWPFRDRTRQALSSLNRYVLLSN